MGRKKLIEDDKLKQLLYEYYDYCDNDFSHFKYSKFGQYIRSNYDPNIKDTLIRRNAVINECLDNLKEKSIEDEEVRTRILDAYELLVLKNKTVSEIAADLGTTDNIIYRDLSERLQEFTGKIGCT